ncbi:MAG: cyclohydrolase FolE2 [Thermoleophilia bacterium]|nr:cyclohydrolase FolE2 [Thermoleophilia bacterium]
MPTPTVPPPKFLLTVTLLSTTTDLQATRPSIALGLDEVGVVGVVRGIVLGSAHVPTTATFDVATSLSAADRGAHMSRFHEAIDHALALVGDDGRDVPSLELLATVLASRAAELQGADRGRATVRATIAWPRVAPASSRRTVDPFEAWATVEVDRRGDEPRTEVTLAVRAMGMTACPCAQGLVRDAALARLASADMDLDEATVAAVLEALPAATHNQRSTGELRVTVPGDAAVTSLADPVDLADLVRGSMSAQVHELLKRDDELAVVEAAHADPRFVEDCVRALLRDAVTSPVLANLPPQARLAVRQVNHESIHAHDVVATREATVAQLREALDLEGTPPPA